MTPPKGTNSENTVVEVEFEISDPQYPLVALSAETGCEAELVQILPRSNGAYTVFQRITGGDPKSVLDLMNDYGVCGARVVSESDDSAIIELRISGDGRFFTISLTDAGAIPTELASRNGVAHIIAEIPSIYSASAVIDQFQKAYPSMKIIARRQKEYPTPFFHRQKLHDTVTRLLTPRQYEVLSHAYARGFYDWPRKTTGEELADELDVSPATFHEHLRSAEQKLLSLIFNM